MVKLNKIGFSLTAAAMSFGMMSAVSADTNLVEQPKQIEIQVASTENVVTKNDLIKKLNAFFPNKFNFLSASDFQMSSGHYYPEDKTIRYDLYFSKKIQGKDVNGSITFVGEDLEIENFYYNPINVADALFPAKVSKEEAQKIATDFIKKFPNGDQYQFDNINSNLYSYYSNQLLTEPINYSFSFIRTKDQVEISDQRIQVNVLGNGEVTQFYSYPMTNKSISFDDVKKVKAKNEVLEKIKENLQVQLQYQINYEYPSDKRNVQLVYSPTSEFTGVQAITGEWLTESGFTQNLPNTKEIETIVPKPLAPKHEGLTAEEAKKIAEKLLKVDIDGVTLTIESIEEGKNYNGREVYYIHYMYDYKNGGYGTRIEIDKNTGDIIDYYDMKNDLLSDSGKNNKTKITSSQALSKAINYLKEWTPSYLHQYALPMSEPVVDEQSGVYNFSFPRIVNGITVIGDNINIGIKFDGSLNNVYVSYQEFENWPSTSNMISEEEALQRFKDALSLKLQYTLQGSKDDDQHYSLVYSPVFNDKGTNSFDATSGEWASMFNEKDYPIITHSTAGEELNYLVQNNILEVKDSSFNADAAITKGEALKTIVKSLTYFYEEYNIKYEEQPHPQTYDNIGPDHPYYNVVEQAVSMGILNPDNSELNTNSQITREELAVWYIRALGLEQAAAHGDIYKLNIKDAKDVKYTGYVALANALEILPTENGLFKPQEKVTYAELAVSTIHLAHKVYESRVSGYRYY